MTARWLTALPVYNERNSVEQVLDEVVRHSAETLVVDDGSSDGTAQLLAGRPNGRVWTHPVNRGYGAALRTAFDYAIQEGYEVLVTIDCDGQHEPQRVPVFADLCRQSGVDIVSGSRYLRRFPGDNQPPKQRRHINRMITDELNACLRLALTDAFCGFKAYRVEALKKLRLTENGYAMPLELWVQAAHHGLSIVELPVPLIYLDPTRTFGSTLDDAEKRLVYYREVLHCSLLAVGHPAGREAVCASRSD